MIGKILEEKRKELGLTLTEMALRVDTSKQRIEQVEKNVTKNPGGKFCLELSKAYRIPLKTLLENLGE
jgi:transcriptional regulator with XRE-family HTH domain